MTALVLAPVFINVMGRRQRVMMSAADAANLRASSKLFNARKHRLRDRANKLLFDSRHDDGVHDQAAEAIIEYAHMFGSAMRLPALLKLLADAPPAVFWKVFLRQWPGLDGTWAHRDVLLDLVRRNALAASPRAFFDENQAAFYVSLSATVMVYRGSSTERAGGLAWTTSRAMAENFARGHRGLPVPDPVIVATKVPRDAILAVFIERDEAEVVIDPDAVALDVTAL
jgi:hypothetical protein